MADDFRNHLANERTLLAWLRTAVALSGFGFVIAKFGLFFREARMPEPGFGRAGTVVAAAGGFVAVLATLRFLAERRDLVRGRRRPAALLPLLLALGIFLLDGYLTWLLLAGGSSG
jgi:putative membrane protein